MAAELLSSSPIEGDGKWWKAELLSSSPIEGISAAALIR